MTRDPLRSLLAKADSRLPARQVTGIAFRVLRRARRRARVRLLCGTVAFLIVATFVLTMSMRGRRHAPIAARDQDLQQAAISSELLSLNEEANFHLKMARSLAAIEDSSSLRGREVGRAAQINPLEKLRELREQSGLILLRGASREDGRTIYWEIARFFPDTSAGRQAQQRLQGSGNVSPNGNKL